MLNNISGTISTLIILPFAEKINKWVGEVNVIVLQQVVESVRMLIYSIWKMTPPYYALVLFRYVVSYIVALEHLT